MENQFGSELFVDRTNLKFRENALPIFQVDYLTDRETCDFDIGKFIFKLKEDVMAAAVIAASEKKPVELLTDYEKLGMIWGSGLPVKYEDGKFSLVGKVGIALIEGKYQIYHQPDPPIKNRRPWIHYSVDI